MYLLLLYESVDH